MTFRVGLGTDRRSPKQKQTAITIKAYPIQLQAAQRLYGLLQGTGLINDKVAESAVVANVIAPSGLTQPGLVSKSSPKARPTAP